MDACVVLSAGMQAAGGLCYSRTAPNYIRGPQLAPSSFGRDSGLLQRTINHICVSCTAPRISRCRLGVRRTGRKDADEAHASEISSLKRGLSVALPTSVSSSRFHAKSCCASLSEAAAFETGVRLESMTINSVVAAKLVAEEVHDNTYLIEKKLVNYESISELYAEVGEDNRQAAEYLQYVEDEEKGLRTSSDYNRRAYLYERVAEIVQARQKKGKKVCEDLEQLQEVMLEEDSGRSPADYRRRAEIFSKSAEVFGFDQK